MPAIGAAGDVDTAMVMLRTAGGKLCQIANSRRCSFGYDQRIEVFGSRRHGARRQSHCDERRRSRARAASHTEPALPFFLERYAEAYRLELDDFIARSNASASSWRPARTACVRCCWPTPRRRSLTERRAGRVRLPETVISFFQRIEIFIPLR